MWICSCKLPTTDLSTGTVGAHYRPEFTRLSVKSLRFLGHLTYEYAASL